MDPKFKLRLQILVCVAFIVQAEGCIFVDRDHDRHYEHAEHHEDHDHGDIDVRVH